MLQGADGLVKEPNVLHEAGHGLLDAYKSYESGQVTQVLTDGASIVKAFTRTREERERIRITRTSPADVIQMSGCKNYETSADTVEGVPSLVRVSSLILGNADRGNELGVQGGAYKTTATKLSFVIVECKGIIGVEVFSETGVE